jgi:hypothetical protein
MEEQLLLEVARMEEQRRVEDNVSPFIEPY